MIARAVLIAGLLMLGLACTTGVALQDGWVADGADAGERDDAPEASAARQEALEPSTRICPTTGAVLECGQRCVILFKGVPVTLFVNDC